MIGCMVAWLYVPHLQQQVLLVLGSVIYYKTLVNLFARSMGRLFFFAHTAQNVKHDYAGDDLIVCTKPILAQRLLTFHTIM